MQTCRQRHSQAAIQLMQGVNWSKLRSNQIRRLTQSPPKLSLFSYAFVAADLPPNSSLRWRSTVNKGQFVYLKQLSFSGNVTHRKDRQSLFKDAAVALVQRQMNQIEARQRCVRFKWCRLLEPRNRKTNMHEEMHESENKEICVNNASENVLLAMAKKLVLYIFHYSW